MNISKFKKTHLYLSLIGLFRLKESFRKFGLKPIYFILSTCLSVLAALFEGITAALLIPLAKGIIDMDFSFVLNIPVLRTLIPDIPQRSFTISNVYIFVFLVVTIFISGVIKNILIYLSSLSFAYQWRNFSSNMRKVVFDKYLSFGKLYFDKTNQGSLHNTLENSTELVAIGLRRLQPALDAFFGFIVYITLMFIISWELTIFVIIIFSLLYRFPMLIVKKIKKSSKIYAAVKTKLSEYIFNVLSCIGLVKAYTQKEKEEERFAILSDAVSDTRYSIDKKLDLVPRIQEINVLIAILLLISATAFIFIKTKSGELSTFLVFFYLVKKSGTMITALSSFQVRLAEISGLMQNIFKVFDDRDKIFVVDGQKEFKGLTKNIEFNHLTFSYGDGTRVLKDVSLVIEKGRVTAIVGPTGAGKTTLINLIMRFYDASSSSVKIDGVDIKEFTLMSLRARMALVSQDILLFNATLKNNIVYGLDRKISDRELTDVVKKARLYDFIISLPSIFNTYIGDRGVKLSGGEKQRVAIARALLKGAEILILDEATSSLDTKTEKLIQEAIDETIRGKTAIVIAHRLSTIKKAHKVVVIENGTLIEEGLLDELLEKKGRFFQYWNEQKFY